MHIRPIAESQENNVRLKDYPSFLFSDAVPILSRPVMSPLCALFQSCPLVHSGSRVRDELIVGSG